MPAAAQKVRQGEERRREIRRMLAEEYPISRIARELGVSTQAIYKHLKVIQKQEGAAA